MPTTTPLTILAVGSTGSVGQHVVAEALRDGHHVRALVRNQQRANRLPDGAEIVVGDLTDASSLTAVEGIDAVVFTHGAAYGSSDAKSVDYGAVRNVLEALHGRPVRIALMTAIGVTRRATTHDWKRRSERLVRASGNAYTIVRPGWFDYNDPDQLEITMLQGDTRHAGNPADGVIARRQIARVLIDALTSDAADHKTFELVAERGPEQPDLEPVFAALDPDPAGQIDGVRDQQNQPLASEPDFIRDDLKRITAHD
jgi:uncharacterized protein YbjT (DUF2867 family)